MTTFTPEGTLANTESLTWTLAPELGPNVRLEPGTSADVLTPHLTGIARIGIEAAGYGDGRLSSVAQHLRQAGFTGRLRAIGPLVPDQWRLLWSLGFDEVEVPDGLAGRQRPESQPFLNRDSAPWPYAARLGLR